MGQAAEDLGTQLKHWRKVRGLSQLALANEVGVSAKHLCFVETGRSKPSLEMMQRLSEGLDVPLRERNGLLHLAGFAPQYSENELGAPELSAVRQIVRTLLAQQDPFPAMAMDRYWNLVEMNEAATRMLAPLGGDGELNAIEIFLGHPMVKQMVENWSELAHHTRERLRAQVRRMGGQDERLIQLSRRADELLQGVELPSGPPQGPALTTRLLMGDRVIQTVSTIASFTGAADALVDDLRIELIFPVDEEAAACFRAAAGL